jgi:hypothetical protein
MVDRMFFEMQFEYVFPSIVVIDDMACFMVAGWVVFFKIKIKIFSVVNAHC